MVSSDDQLASVAGIAALAAGGSAVDAAIAANAVLAVTAPHACGLGGDLFALVHEADGPPSALMAVGRAGSGANPDRLRAEGAARMPMHGDIRSVTVPGCVDGWVTLHERYGRLDLAEVLRAAIGYATSGFPPSREFAWAASTVDPSVLGEMVDEGGPLSGRLVRRTALARQLQAVADRGRDSFYGGELGRGLVALAEGELTTDDVQERHAEWVEPLRATAFDSVVWGPPPVSQAYIGLAASALAADLPLPDDPTSAAWAHLLVESIRQTASDRPDALHEGTDGPALLAPERLATLASRIHPDRASDLAAPASPAADTTYLAVVDGEGMAVSLIQSNASSFGSHLVVPGTGVVLQNRGVGFSLRSGHPTEYGPRRRPPHTLSPYLVTTPEGRLRGVLGTRGADAQPQVVLQLLVRWLHLGASPGAAARAPRWLVTADDDAFHTWDDPGRSVVSLEAGASPMWGDGLRALGHGVSVADARDPRFGSAHLIAMDENGVIAGAADPRTSASGAVGV